MLYIGYDWRVVGLLLLFISNNEFIANDRDVRYAPTVDLRERLLGVESALKIGCLGSLVDAERIIHTL